MKLLQINAVYGFGSTGTITQSIDLLAQEMGIESHVAYSQASVAPQNGYQIGSMPGKKLHALLSRVEGRQAYYSRHATRKFLRYLDILQPDVVQLHNLHGNYIHLNMLLDYLARKQIPTVITLHDCWFFTGKCFHYAAVGCDQWLTGCKSCPKQYSDTPAYLRSVTDRVWLDRKKYLSAIENLTVVGVSEWLTGEAARSFLKDKRFMTIHNGIDTEVFRPVDSDFRQKHGLQDKTVILGMANKWLSAQNSGLTERVMQALGDEYRLVLVGCSPEQQRQPHKNVLKLGYIRNARELAKVYSMADMFVNTTWEDSLPTVNLEALSCGTPVITHKVTGAAETISGDVGLWAEPGNAEDLIEKIRCMARIGKGYYSSKCRGYALEVYNQSMCLQKYIDLYREVLS